MATRGIIENEKSVTGTEKGMQFHKDYSRINELINEINEKYQGSVKTSVPSFAV